MAPTPSVPILDDMSTSVVLVLFVLNAAAIFGLLGIVVRSARTARSLDQAPVAPPAPREEPAPAPDPVPVPVLRLAQPLPEQRSANGRHGPTRRQLLDEVIWHAG